MRIVTTHKNTDFDALASVVAATILYPDAVPILPQIINPNVKAFLSIHQDFLNIYSLDDVPLEAATSLVVVDINSWNRLEEIKSLPNRKNLEIILWDHHAGEGDIPATWKCQEEVGANITLMIRTIKLEEKKLSPIQATLFLAGLYEDTGNLSFASTTAEDAYAAAYLLEHKADLNIVNSFLRPVYGEKQKDVLFQMLQSAQRDKLNGLSISVNTLAIDGHVDNLAVVVQMYRDILNVDAAFGIFINREQDKCMVIGRSTVDSLDIGEVMRNLGGGGHQGAGSAVLKAVQPREIERMIRAILKGNRPAAVRVSDLMSSPVITVSPDTRMEKVASILRKRGCTGIPVVEHEKLVGIVSRKDFKKIKKESQLKAPVKAFMKTNVITISPDKSPIQAARRMVKHDIGRLPVLEHERVIGILTRSDALLYFYDLLPHRKI